MAGDGHHNPVRIDPAIERWAYMRENVYQHFAFTRKATRSVFLVGAVLPAAIFAASYYSDAKFDWAGKRQGSSLLVNAPKTEEQE
ncbi:hypothetical protein P7C73_g4698, partial [Tremellales sp. Uapishka_1]